jgi:hypothetical protein
VHVDVTDFGNEILTQFLLSLVIIIGAGSLRYLDGSCSDGGAASGARRSGHHRVRALTESSEPDTIDTFFPEEFLVNGKKEEKRETNKFVNSVTGRK